MNPVVHFEISYEDRDRAAAFYQKAFGWKPHFYGPDMGDYVVVQTSPTDEKGMLQENGRINGGLYKSSNDHSGVSVVVAVDDIWAAMQKVVECGGTVLGGQKPGEPDEIPGVGIYCSIIDSEGNKIAMLQPFARQ